MPEAKATDEGIVVAAQARAGRKRFQFFGIAAAEDDVIGGERFLQALDDFGDVAAPFFLPEAFEAANAEVVFVGFPFFVEKMREFHGLEKTVDDHRGAEAGAETEEEHVAAFVTAEGLHGGVVDDFHREAEGFGEIEGHPALAEIVGLAEGPLVDDRAWVADGDAIVVPILGDFLDLFHHAAGGHRGAGREAARLFLAGGEHFDVGAADVDHQDFGGFGFLCRFH